MVVGQVWTLSNFPMYGDLDLKLQCFVSSSVTVKLASTTQKESKLCICCLGEEKHTELFIRLFSTSSQ